MIPQERLRQQARKGFSESQKIQKQLRELAQDDFSDAQQSGSQQQQSGSSTPLHNQGQNISHMNKGVQQAIDYHKIIQQVEERIEHHHKLIRELNEDIAKWRTLAHRSYQEAKDPRNLHIKERLQKSSQMNIKHVENLEKYIGQFMELINIDNEIIRKYNEIMKKEGK